MTDDRHNAMQPDEHPLAAAGTSASEIDVERVRQELGRAVDVMCRQSAQALTEAFRSVGEALAALTEAFRPFVELARQLNDAGLLDDPPPTNPQERALWLLRHRNTGPQPGRRRPPRTLGMGRQR